MDSLNNKKYEWFLVAKEGDKQIAAYNCPKEIVGNIIKIIASFQIGEMTTPNEETVKQLKKALENNVISCETINKITGISKEYIEKLLLGVYENYDTSKIIALTELVEKIK